jgi:SpoVK/Ycf46/Vps4 family AAA+-type ATPase
MAPGEKCAAEKSALEYLRLAEEAEKGSRINEAYRLYLLAGKALLEAAQVSAGSKQVKFLHHAEELDIKARSLKGKAVPKGGQTLGLAHESENDINRVKKPEAVRETENAACSGASFSVPEMPNVFFSDIAGLEDVKESIKKRIILPRLYPQVYKDFEKKPGGGILLYGPPGTGKTMIAKAIATEVKARFFPVRCSDVVGKFFGDAERNIKQLFDTARSFDNAVIFFDEFEALAPRRGGHSTVMNRLVPEILSQMDGFAAAKNNLMVLAATNRPWDIDTAFLRPPRLTEKIYVGLPDLAARLYLIKKKLTNVPHDSDIDFDAVAGMTEGFNAADVAEFCEKLKEGPIGRTIEASVKTPQPITWDDVLRTAEQFKSSVQKQDLEALRRWEQEQNGKM